MSVDEILGDNGPVEIWMNSQYLKEKVCDAVEKAVENVDDGPRGPKSSWGQPYESYYLRIPTNAHPSLEEILSLFKNEVISDVFGAKRAEWRVRPYIRQNEDGSRIVRCRIAIDPPREGARSALFKKEGDPAMIFDGYRIIHPNTCLEGVS